MSKITFYISKQNDSQSYLQLLCKIISKAYATGHQLYIFSSDTEFLKELDESLWIFNPNSFIAHDLILKADHSVMPSSKIILSNQIPNQNFGDLLINLDSQIPPFFTQFNRVIEVIDQEPQRLALGRKRYQIYSKMDDSIKIFNV